MIYPVVMEDPLSMLEEIEDEDVLFASISKPDLFALLVRKYEAPFLRKAQSIVHDSQESEDIVQETFTKIYLNAKRFKKQEGAQFSSWGYRILINTSLSHYQKRKRQGQRTVELDEEIWNLIPDKDMQQFEKFEMSDEVASVLSRMSPLFARALQLFFIEGKPQEEIAQMEGLSVGAVKTRVHRAKSEFRKIYQSLTNNT